jgi:protein PhnA
MSLSPNLESRGGTCELCAATENLSIYEVPPVDRAVAGTEAYLCERCVRQVEKKEPLDSQHWQCLTTSMWSEVPAVQVLAWRMLQRLRAESWASDNLEILYLADDLLDWAKAAGDHDSDGAVELHQDCNGNLLEDGDTVVLTKTLDVKGSTLNAKMGTVVKNIRLAPSNTGQIEGRVEGQLIVILTKYVRKQSR